MMIKKAGFLIFAAFLWAILVLEVGCGGKRGRAVVFISLDTLRQDHLGCCGYNRDTSPNLDRFAEEEAVLFESVHAQAPYTLTSHMSMLTGLYPEAHGILNPTLPDGSGRTARLSGKVTTLAEAFKTNGFKTAAFTDGIFLVKRYGFEQGFDEFYDQRRPDPEPNGFRRFGAAVHEWILKNRESDFFLFIHTFDTHAPYDAPEPFRSMFKDAPSAREIPFASLQHCSLLGCHGLMKLHEYEDLKEVVDVYDGCIAYADQEVGGIFELLEDEGLWKDALILVTSDHGETFMESGLMIGHGLSPTNEETLVPLLIKLPESRHGGRRVGNVVETVDIMPTLLSALDLPVSADVQGQNLLEGLEHDRWEKDYAYGTSPHTGCNHYFLRGGIKFIEAVHDPERRMIKMKVLPKTPATCEKPREPYYATKAATYYYDFGKDPLGVNELFLRGDRAYDLRSSKSEWKARKIADEELLIEYKEAAFAVAARAEELGKKYISEEEHGDVMSEEEMKELSSLGYGGVIAADRMGAGTDEVSGRAPLALKADPPLIDRMLLNRGDEFVWAFKRFIMKADRKTRPEELMEGLEKARSDYGAFMAANPEKLAWVEWRLRFLDMASEMLAGEPAKKPKRNITRRRR